MTLLTALALIFYCVAWGQPHKGATPTQVSPEIVQQMRREAAGTSQSDLAARLRTTTEELQKLRHANVDILRRVQILERKRAELEDYVGSLDISVDTRILTEAKDDIKELKRAQKAADEEASRERQSARSVIGTIETGVFMLIIGATFKIVQAWWKDRKERASREVRHHSVMAAIGEVKAEAQVAFREANNVNAKIASLGLKAQSDRDASSSPDDVAGRH